MKKIGLCLMILMICSLFAPMAVGQSNNSEVLTIDENVSIEKDGSENYSTSLFQNDGDTVLRLRSIDDASGCWVDGIEKHTWAVGENCNEALSPKQFEEEPPIIVGPCIEQNVAGIIEYSTDRDCGTQVIISLDSDIVDNSSDIVRVPGPGDGKEDTGCWVHSYYMTYEGDASNNAEIVETIVYEDPCPVSIDIDDSQNTAHDNDSLARSQGQGDEEGCWVVIKDGNSGTYGEKVWENPCPYVSTVRSSNFNFTMDYPGVPGPSDPDKPSGCWVVSVTILDSGTDYASVVSTRQYVEPCPVINGIDNSADANAENDTEARASGDEEGCWVVIRDGNSGTYGEKIWENPCPYKHAKSTSITETVGSVSIGNSTSNSSDIVRVPGPGDGKEDTGCWVHSYYMTYEGDASNNAEIVETIVYEDPCPVSIDIDDSQNTAHDNDSLARSQGQGDEEGCWVVIKDGNSGTYGEKVWENPCPYVSNVRNSISGIAQHITLPSGDVLILNFVGIESSSLPCFLEDYECKSYSGVIENNTLESSDEGCWNERVWSENCVLEKSTLEDSEEAVPGFTIALSFMAILTASIFISREDSNS